MELYGMEYIDLTKNSIKILGIHFSYDRKIENEENFIKTLAISKVIKPALVTNLPHVIINPLNKIQKDFLWNQKHPQIRHCAVCNTCEYGGLKCFDILNKLTSLQCSSIKRLYMIPPHIAGKKYLLF